MFGKRKDSMHGRPSRRSSRRRQDAWSSSVVGSHARRQTGTHTHRAPTGANAHRRPSSQLDQGK